MAAANWRCFAEPRRWVVDASVAFCWFADVPGSPQAVRLLEADPPAQLLAPDLVLIELLNAGFKSHRAHPAYDCLYVALAERDDATLVTADRRLLGRLTGWGMDRPEVLDLADLAPLQRSVRGAGVGKSS